MRFLVVRRTLRCRFSRAVFEADTGTEVSNQNLIMGSSGGNPLSLDGQEVFPEGIITDLFGFRP